MAGHLTSETYPSGRIVNTEYDSAGRTAGVKNQSTGAYYAGGAATDATNRIQYAAHGAVSALKLGNGLWEHANFNTRLQPEQIGLGTQSTNSSKLQLDYTYHAPNAADNNGNVQSQTITMPGLSVTQSYSYDSLNRLQVAQEQNGASWKQVFKYDQYGNRNFDAGTTTTDLASKVTNPTINTATNQIDRTAAGQGNILYDPAGNLTRDISGLTYGYDGENKQISYAGGSTITGGTSYYYDGDGHRVKKADSNTATIYVYDVAGQLVAEYNSSASQSSGGTSYLTSDNLGTPRVITDASGNVKSRHDYLPFGEELFANDQDPNVPRKTTQGYVGDNVSQRFTGKIRDGETGLDYFQARYYASTQGRFTSADSFGGRLTNPQTLNLYAYVLNNPLKYIDPTGHFAQDLKPAQADPLPFDTTDTRGKHYHVTARIVEMHEVPESVGEPGTIGQFIPIYGNGRNAINDFQTGHPYRGAFHTAMAVSDVFIVKSLVVSAVKVVVEDALVEAGANVGRLVVGGGRATGFPALEAGDVSLNTSLAASPHVMGDIGAAPFKSGSFGELFFERVPFDAITGNALSESSRVLQPGGRLSIITGYGADASEITTGLRQNGFTNIGIRLPTGANRTLSVTAIRGGP